MGDTHHPKIMVGELQSKRTVEGQVSGHAGKTEVWTLLQVKMIQNNQLLEVQGGGCWIQTQQAVGD